MADLRHNSDLDAAMGFGPTPPPTPPPEPPLSNSAAAALTTAIQNLATALNRRASVTSQAKQQQQAKPKPPLAKPVPKNAGQVVAVLNAILQALQNANAKQPAPQPQPAAGPARKAAKGGRQKPNWLIRQLARFSGGNKLGRAGQGLFRRGRAVGARKRAGGGALRGLGVFGMAAGAVADFTGKVKESATRLVEANRIYAQASASMALVMAQRDLQEQQRSRRIGDATSGTARELVESEQKLKDNTEGFTKFAGNLGNSIVSGLSDALSGVLEPLNKAVDRLNDKLFGEQEKKEQPATGGEVLQQAQADYEAARKRNDPWFDRPDLRR